MKLYISESPLKAADFAKALNATSRGDGYYYNSDVRITWAIGHLVGLAPPDAYDPELKKWSKETLPILPEKFKLEVSEGKSKQFNAIKKLMEEADEIVCATDCDREGDLIFHYIHTLSGSKKPYKRVLPNDLTANGIKKVLANELPPRTPIIHSGTCRSRTDWLIGMNGTRALTIAANKKITIGRVQAPTLALVCERYLENKNFVPTPYYPITIQLEKDQIKFTARIKENPTDEEAAKNIVSSISDTSNCTFSERKQVSEKQPIPYELGALQIDASKRFGFSAKQTLDLAQSLYEKHKLTTYPRTDSGYLTEDLFADVPNRINKLLGVLSNDSFHPLFDLKNLPTRCVDNKKAPNHHGIIPTDDLSGYENLNEKEKQLFDLIALRFLAAFAPECIKDKTKYEFNNATNTFVATGSVTVEAGWRTIFEEPTNEDDPKDDDSGNDLPSVVEGESLPTSDPNYSTKMTKAPPLLTNDSLVKLMMSCGKKLDDDTLRKAMLENELRTGGIGTSATRGEIIENVFKSGLITHDKRKIIPTEMGLSLYEQIKDKDISKPELTANMQLKLDQIMEGEYDHNQFMNEIVEYTKKVTSDMLEIGSEVETDNIKMKCPKCKEGNIIEGKKGFGCDRWNQDPKCDFVIWKSKSGKTLPVPIVMQLLSGEQTKEVKGFKYKDKDGTFNAPLKLNTETWKVDFVFSSEPTTKNGEAVKCPSCESDMRLNDHGAFCSSDSCEVKIWRKKSDKKLSDSQLIALVTKGKTPSIKGFKSKAGKPFDASLKLDDKFNVVFDFND